MKKFTLTITDDGKLTNFDAENEGFTALEIVGALEIKLRDILKQLEVPAKFTRKVVKEDGSIVTIEDAEND